MSLGHEHRLVLIGLAGPMDVMNLSLSLGATDNATQYDDDYIGKLFGAGTSTSGQTRY